MKMVFIVITAALTAVISFAVPATAQAATKTCPFIIAHRGRQDPNTRAENSISAYENAWKYVMWVETDVQFTSDNVPVIMHDSTVDRTTDGTGAVNDMTYAQFAKLHMKTSAGVVLAEHPPTLWSVLDDAHTRGRKVVVELKTNPTSAQMTAFLSRMKNAYKWTRVHSFYWTALSRVKTANANYTNRDGYLTYSTPTGSTMHYIEPEITRLNVANAQTLRSHGHPVVPWTVDTAAQYSLSSKAGAYAVYSDNVWAAKYVWEKACAN